MPRACTVCEHPEREAIDRVLVGGASNRSVASLHDVSEAAVRRHKSNHLPAKLVMAEKAAEVAEADTLLEQVKGLQGRAYAILEKAEETGELRTALGAIREASGNLELLAKLLGEHHERRHSPPPRPLPPRLTRALPGPLRAAVQGALRQGLGLPPPPGEAGDA